MKPSSFLSRVAALLSLCLLATSSGCASHAAAPIVQEPEGEVYPTPASRETPDVIEVRVLLVAYAGAQGASAEQQRTPAQALDRANMLANMARGSDQLITLVPKYSDRADASGENHGAFKLRPAQPAPFSSELANSALVLGIGQVSNPIQTPEGYVVLERMKDPLPGPERIAARHILIGYAGSPQTIAGATRSEAEARALAEQIVIEARAPGADWNALAAKYTDEPGSKTTGGDLHKFGRGQMVPAFERAAFALQVGQISDVVQSPFGFHVIQRYE